VAVLYDKPLKTNRVSTFLTFIIFFRGMLLVSICLKGHLAFYPISLSTSGDFGPITGIVLAVSFRVILFTF